MGLDKLLLRDLMGIAENAGQPSPDDRNKYEGTLTAMNHISHVARNIYRENEFKQLEFRETYLTAYKNMVNIVEQKYKECGWNQ